MVTSVLDSVPWEPWPANWAELKSGEDCKLCALVETEDPDWGVPIYTGKVATGFLSVRGQIPGYCWVIWNQGHACEPTDLEPTDVQHFFEDMLAVGRATEAVLQPAKTNYDILGNTIPHLHAHVIPRPQLDPNPHHSLPWDYLRTGRRPPDEVHHLATALRRALKNA